MEKPSYYAIIPSEVRYDENLSANEKLLYGEITALASQSGECWASNAYFSKLYQRNNRTISRWIASLVDYNYVNTRYTYKPNSKEIDKRIIKLTTKVSEGYSKVCHRGIDKNSADNNTRNNNTSINKAIVDAFEYCWSLYGKKGNKKSALNYWLQYNFDDRKKIKEAIEPYKASREFKYMKDFSGWINPTYRRFEDATITQDKEIIEL